MSFKDSDTNKRYVFNGTSEELKELMKDVPGKASSKLIKTKTASGLSLPRMVLTDNKSKAAEKRTAGLLLRSHN